MVEGIEKYFQQLAEAAQEAIQEEWSKLRIESEHYPEFFQEYCEYWKESGGVENTFSSVAISRCLIEMRQLFKEAEKPLWGRFIFELDNKGDFEVDFDFDNCDENGFLDEAEYQAKFDAYLQKHLDAIRGD